MKTQSSSLLRLLIRQFYRFILLPTTVALVYHLVIFTPAFAQTASVSVWPPRLEAMIKPGKSITQVYRLKNQGDNAQLTIKIVPFTAADETGRMNLQLDQKPPGFFSLLNADLPNLPVKLNLKAGEARELVLKIAIPAEAEDADYPTALAIETNTAGLLGGSGSIAQPVVAVPILLTVSRSGNPNRIAKIEEFSAAKIIDSFSPAEFILRVKNQSFTRLIAVGQVEIYNTFGKKTATLPLRQDHILAGTVRQLKMEGSDPSIFWNPVFPLGRYTATVKLTPEDTTNTITQTIYFWAIPYKAILALGLLLTGFKALTVILKGRKLKL